MSRYGKVLALMMVGGLALMGCAPASVEEEVAALSERVETLESQITSLQAAGPPSAAPSHVLRTNSWKLPIKSASTVAQSRQYLMMAGTCKS